MSQKHNKKSIIPAVIFALIICGIVFVIYKNKDAGESVFNKVEIKFPNSGEETTNDEMAIVEPKGETVNGTYTASPYNFIFKPLADETVSQFKQGVEGDVFVINKQGKGIIAQIYVSAYDEAPETLTQTKITTETGIKASGWSTVTVAGNKALSFTNSSNNPATKEIWFVRGGNVYQITGYTNSTDTLNNLVKTFGFK